MTNPLISLIVPVYNEEANVERAYESITKEIERYKDLDFEIIFTDNHSTDSTFEILRHLAETDQRIKVVRFTRNFGFNRSILTGYRLARGGAAIQIDCDLEDPPLVLHEFIRLWCLGHDVVVGIRTQRAESRFMALLRNAFYRFLAGISENPLQIDAGDFRLIDRSVLDQLQVIEDARPYMRGLISELARNPIGVPYTRNRREFGESKFPLSELVRLALDGIYAQSIVPLQLATYVGLGVATATMVAAAVYMMGRLIAPKTWPAGFATTTVLILFGISLNALFLGIIGQYVARIYQQIRLRPTVVIEQAVNAEVKGAMYKKEGGHGLQRQ
jgi:polyisoprenyl-phosphate glycosyltransferase